MTQQASAIGGSKLCPACGASFSVDMTSCPHDGMLLVEPDPMIGQVLDGKYEVLQFVGQGGMSVVYKAVQQKLDRRVAIKLMKRELLTDPANVQRFRREAQVASSLHHPNVNAVYGVGVTPDGQPFMVLEFLEGKSLAKVLEAEKPLTIPRAVRLFSQILAGMAQAHKLGFIHRDLKPSNVVVTVDADGHEIVKVVDFGTAKLLPELTGVQQQLTHAGEVLGTLLYMSPEQKKGAKIDARSDLYAIAYMLFEAVEKNGVVPEEVRALVEKGLREDPALRYQTANDMCRDLLRLDSSALLPAARKHVRNPLIGLGLVTGVVLSAVAGMSFLWLHASPVNPLRLEYFWLRVMHRNADSIAAAGNRLALEEAKQGDLIAAEHIYEDELVPTFLELSPQTRADCLLGMGRLYLQAQKIDKAKEQMYALGKLTWDQRKEHGVTSDLLNLARDRMLMEAEICGLPPTKPDGIHKLVEIAGNLGKKNFDKEADETFNKAWNLCREKKDQVASQWEVAEAWRDYAFSKNRLEQAYQINSVCVRILEERGGPGLPADAVTRMVEGQALLAQGKVRDADSAFRRALEVMKPDNRLLPQLYMILGSIAKQRSRVDSAIELYENALVAAKKHPLPKESLVQIYSDMGFCLRREHYMKEALPYFQKAYELGGDQALVAKTSPELADGYSRCLNEAGDHKKERQIADKILALASPELAKERGFWQIDCRVADVLRSQNEHDAALKYAAKGVELADTLDHQATAAHVMGTIYLAKEDNPNALKWFLQCEEVGSHSSYPYNAVIENEMDIVQVLIRLKRLPEATERLDKIYQKIGPRLSTDLWRTQATRLQELRDWLARSSK